MSDRLMNPREVAGLLGVSEGHVRNMRWLGDGPAYIKLGHRTVRYSEREVTRFIRSREIVPR